MAGLMDTTYAINWFYQKVKIDLFRKLLMREQRKSDVISRQEQNLGIKEKGGGMNLSQTKSHGMRLIKK